MTRRKQFVVPTAVLKTQQVSNSVHLAVRPWTPKTPINNKTPISSKHIRTQTVRQTHSLQDKLSISIPIPCRYNRATSVCVLFFPYITCGIYAIVWLVQLVNDLNAAAKEPNATSGGVVFLLSIVTCGIYMLYWMYKAGELVNKAKMLRGRPTDGSNGILYLVLSIFGLGIVSYALIQNELNQLAQS